MGYLISLLTLDKVSMSSASPTSGLFIAVSLLLWCLIFALQGIVSLLDQPTNFVNFKQQYPERYHSVRQNLAWASVLLFIPACFLLSAGIITSIEPERNCQVISTGRYWSPCVERRPWRPFNGNK